MNLVVCPNRQFSVYLLAYIKKFGKGRQFALLIEGACDIPLELAEVAHSLNSKFVNEIEVQSQIYEELLIHSYFKFGGQASFISKINFKTLSLYSDGMRNGFHGLAGIDTRLSKLI